MGLLRIDHFRLAHVLDSTHEEDILTPEVTTGSLETDHDTKQKCGMV
jgi:hypothetical protein